MVCAPAGTGDAGCFEQTLSVDGKSHQGGTLVDALGRTAYVQRYTGSGTYTLYATARYTYDFVGELTRIVQPDGTTQTTFGYDMAGRKTSLSDPDLGAETYAYDQDGNLTQSVDPRGAAGTTFTGYDGLDRPIWRNTTNTPTGAYDTYTYDATAGGNAGIGRLTGETFAAGTLSGSYAYTYDGRGQQTASTLTVAASSYPLASTYDDAGNVLTQSYPDGETIANSYTPEGWLSGVTTTKSGTTTTLASGLAYTGVGGAFGELTGMHLGGGYDTSATYDLLDRATDLKTKRTSDNAVLFDQTRTFDGAGNVTTAQTTLPAGTDNQAFCYDEQDRLTWSSSATATPPCGGGNTAGTLTAAQYTQAFTYDVMGRLATGPLGSYAYGSAAHVHAATAIGTQYTAAYDAAGDMTCRAPSPSSTCAGTQTGAQLAYNNEGELTAWQNAPTSPTTTAKFLYDGQGQRVAQQATSGSTTTTTVYVGGVEEVATTGATTTTTAFYYAGSKRIGLSVNGVVSYLAADGLGSANVTLSASGSVTASGLYAPYGGVRYSSGTMPTTYGFTGQRADVVSGLDYYGARYYDPLAGQFTSADSVLPGTGFDLWGLSRYAYVEGNPENRTDPSGHVNVMEGGNGAEPIQNAFQGTYAWGGGKVIKHAGFKAPYRPADKSSPPAPAPQPPDTAKLFQDALHAVQSVRTSQLLAPFRDSWSSLNSDMQVALMYLSMGGDSKRWCRSASCSQGMQAAMDYVHNLQIGMALAMTASALARAGGAEEGNFVYRGGSDSLKNLTPRASDLEGEPPGLSTWRDPGQALAKNNKAQKIDLDKLMESNPSLQAIEEETGHVTITAQDWDTLIDWSEARELGEDAENPMARSIRGALAGEVR